MRLELTPAEEQLLLEILEERYRELLLEVRHAHHHRKFRTLLREKQLLLERIIDRFGARQAEPESTERKMAAAAASACGSVIERE